MQVVLVVEINYTVPGIVRKCVFGTKKHVSYSISTQVVLVKEEGVIS